MADFLYTPAKNRILSTNAMNLVTADIKALLVTPDYVPDSEQEFIDDGTINAVSEFEVSGTGYIAGFGNAGRKLLTGKIFSNDSTNHVVRYIFDDISWLGINVGLVGGIILCLEAGSSDTTSRLISYRSSGGFPQLTDGSELRIVIDPVTGFFTF